MAATAIWHTGQATSIDVADADGSMAEKGAAESGIAVRDRGANSGRRPSVGRNALHESARDALRARSVDRLQRFTELVATAVANATAHSELVAAQRRVIEAADAARERLTGDIHDGAQQQFVNSLINLQRAQRKWSSDPDRARELLDRAAAAAEDGVETLRELAAGIHPTILSDMGLAAALESLVARYPDPGLAPDRRARAAALTRGERLLLLLRGAHEHRRGTCSRQLRLRASGGRRRRAEDQGSRRWIGGAAIGSDGSGLVGLKDRIGALEGSITLSSPPGGAGTTLSARIPARRLSQGSALQERSQGHV